MRKFVWFTGLVVILFCAGSAMAQDVPYSEIALSYCAVTNNGSGTSSSSSTVAIARQGSVAFPAGEVASSSSSGGFAGNTNTIALHGFCGSIAGNIRNWLGIVADIGENRLSESGVTGNLFTYLFGPRISFNHGGRLIPFGQVLLGGARLRVTVPGNGTTTITTSTNFNAFAMTVGGGVDYKLSEHIGVRLAQAEYFLTKFGGTHQNNGRFGGGLIIRLGKRP